MKVYEDDEEERGRRGKGNKIKCWWFTI